MSSISQQKMKDNYSIKDLVLLKNFLKYLRPYTIPFIFYLILNCFATVAISSEALLWGYYLNALDGKILFFSSEASAITSFTIIYFVMFIFYIITGYFAAIGFNKIGQNIVYDIRQDVFNHIETLSIGQINAMPIGKYVTRVTNDTQTLSNFFTDSLVSLFESLVAIITPCIYLFVENWVIALIVFAFIPFIFILTFFVRKSSKKKYREVRNAFTDINAFTAENLSGMLTTQIFNQEERKAREFDQINDRLEQKQKKVMHLWAFYFPALYCIEKACEITVVLSAVYFALIGEVTVGFIFTYYLFVFQFFQPIQRIATVINNISNVLSSVEKINSVLSVECQVEDTINAREVDKFFGTIEFKNVWFAYVGEEWVLKDVSFKINAKESAAFVGATGAGKSTIIGLLVRNYNIQKGEILIDGVNINDIKIESLRRGIGQMLQDVFLFSGTIAQNIALNDNTISLEEIEEASKYVGAHNFISKLANGYNEEVRERGNNFSTGQRQLISFARVVLYKPDIIMLDEATANIDTETELLIQDSLSKMKNIGTMLIVAHRLSTIKSCDKIFVLHKGVLVEQGNHQQLLKNKGIYYNLYKLQNME